MICNHFQRPQVIDKFITSLSWWFCSLTVISFSLELKKSSFNNIWLQVYSIKFIELELPTSSMKLDCLYSLFSVELDWAANRRWHWLSRSQELFIHDRSIRLTYIDFSCWCPEVSRPGLPWHFSMKFTGIQVPICMFQPWMLSALHSLDLLSQSHLMIWEG